MVNFTQVVGVNGVPVQEIVSFDPLAVEALAFTTAAAATSAAITAEYVVVIADQDFYLTRSPNSLATIPGDTNLAMIVRANIPFYIDLGNVKNGKLVVRGVSASGTMRIFLPLDQVGQKKYANQ